MSRIESDLIVWLIVRLTIVAGLVVAVFVAAMWLDRSSETASRLRLIPRASGETPCEVDASCVQVGVTSVNEVSVITSDPIPPRPRRSRGGWGAKHTHARRTDAWNRQVRSNREATQQFSVMSSVRDTRVRVTTAQVVDRVEMFESKTRTGVDSKGLIQVGGQLFHPSEWQHRATPRGSLTVMPAISHSDRVPAPRVPLTYEVIVEERVR